MSRKKSAKAAKKSIEGQTRAPASAAVVRCGDGRQGRALAAKELSPAQIARALGVGFRRCRSGPTSIRISGRRSTMPITWLAHTGKTLAPLASIWGRHFIGTAFVFMMKNLFLLSTKTNRSTESKRPRPDRPSRRPRRTSMPTEHHYGSRTSGGVGDEAVRVFEEHRQTVNQKHQKH